ncbi:MAG: hypothetical protein GY846_25080, partial [Deltaproteobacteria bacterium]|nr:hypothetical protein [Deltaproteobacteria bacterium]
MQSWYRGDAKSIIYRFNDLSKAEQAALIAFLDEKFPPETVKKHIHRRRKALENLSTNRTILSRSTQRYPETIASNTVSSSAGDLKGNAVVLTAGGEGERLRLSLETEGAAPELLKNFTKATFPLPGFYRNFGALHTNLALLSRLCRDTGIDIPVIVTTGPPSSKTAQIIPEVLEENNFFGLKHVQVINQDERLHLSGDEQIAYTVSGNQARPVTHPDETGGPIMKLKKLVPGTSCSTLDWCKDLGCTKLVLLQATALYDPNMITTIASTGKQYDGLGVGIARETFPEDDPYGTFILVEQGR